MTISAPSTEHPQSSSGVPNSRSAWGQKVGQPRANFLLDRLARTYDWCIEKIADDLEFFCIAAFAAVPVAFATGIALTTGDPFWMLLIPLCSSQSYLTAMSSVVSYRDKIRELNNRIAEINDSALWRLCENRRELNEALMAENDHLEQDVAHWKALCLTQRGGLGADSAAAGELSRSENKEASAAVVHFPTDGAA